MGETEVGSFSSTLGDSMAEALAEWMSTYEAREQGLLARASGEAPRFAFRSEDIKSVCVGTSFVLLCILRSIRKSSVCFPLG